MLIWWQSSLPSSSAEVSSSNSSSSSSKLRCAVAELDACTNVNPRIPNRAFEIIFRQRAAIEGRGTKRCHDMSRARLQKHLFHSIGPCIGIRARRLGAYIIVLTVLLSWVRAIYHCNLQPFTSSGTGIDWARCDKTRHSSC